MSGAVPCLSLPRGCGRISARGIHLLPPADRMLMRMMAVRREAPATPRAHLGTRAYPRGRLPILTEHEFLPLRWSVDLDSRPVKTVMCPGCVARGLFLP